MDFVPFLPEAIADTFEFVSNAASFDWAKPTLPHDLNGFEHHAHFGRAPEDMNVGRKMVVERDDDAKGPEPVNRDHAIP
jgi:hypothetical protein